MTELSDSDNESEIARLEELEFKARCAFRAANSIKFDILDTKNFTPDLALKLGGLFAGYELEFHLHESDRIAEEIQLNKNDERVSGLEEDLSANNEARLEIEDAISDAQNGKFGKLKAWIMSTSELLLEVEGSDELHEKFLQLLDVIPSEGEPFQLPDPAWTDSRFNR